MLLRAKGSTIEAWRQPAARGRASASCRTRPTPAAGYVGVGLRGTTGRLDDFGARTLGGAPPAPRRPPTRRNRGQAQVSLEPDQPLLDGGSHRDTRAASTSYRIERCPGASCDELPRDRDRAGQPDDLLRTRACTRPPPRTRYRVRAEDTATPTPSRCRLLEPRSLGDARWLAPDTTATDRPDEPAAQAPSRSTPDQPLLDGFHRHRGVSLYRHRALLGHRAAPIRRDRVRRTRQPTTFRTRASTASTVLQATACAPRTRTPTMSRLLEPRLGTTPATA